MPETAARERSFPQGILKGGGLVSATALLTFLGNHLFSRIDKLEEDNNELRKEVVRFRAGLQEEIVQIQAAQAQWGTMAEQEERLRRAENELDVTRRIFTFLIGREVPRSRLFEMPDEPPEEAPPPAAAERAPDPAEPQAPVDPERYRRMQEQKYAPPKR